MQYQIRYLVQSSKDGVLWHDEAVCMALEEAEDYIKEEKEMAK